VGDQIHTSVSAEAIRFALRHRFQLEGLGVNRSFDGDRLTWEDEKHQEWDAEADSIFIDDDLMSFMNAEAAKKESEDEAVGRQEVEEEGDDDEAPKPARRRASRFPSAVSRRDLLQRGQR
jgi:CRISPR-associated protein Cst2